MTRPADASHSWLEEPTVQPCLELLTFRHVGRAAYRTDGPVVLPVRHVVHEDPDPLPTSPHGSQGRRVGASLAAFWVDEIRDEASSEWGVLVRGPARFVASHEFPEKDQRPEPCMTGLRSSYVRIVPQSNSGRRLFPSTPVGLDQSRRS